MNKYKFLEPKPCEEGSNYASWLAKNQKRDEKVIIKILKRKFYSLEECKRHKEVQVLQSLKHKNVQKLREMFNDANELLMVFDFEQENVKGVMKKRGRPFSETETKVIMLQVFQGLSHVHEMDFIHRNLRPEILLCDKEATTIKISDFSMAKSVHDSLGEFAVSPLWYQSPEVLLRATTYTDKIDTWAAGCIMSELLTGTPILPGTSDRDQMKLICELIGNFTTRTWPDGAMLRRSIGYPLPTPTTGKGLGEAGIQASSDAKSLIMDCITWAPEQRLAAKKALRHDFFKSDGMFINQDENQEILKSIGQQLDEWRYKWERDLNRASLKELDRIVAEVNKKQPYRDRNSNRQSFAGFENSNPLLGDSTSRNKWSQPQTNGMSTQRPNLSGEQARTYPLDSRATDRNSDTNQCEEDLRFREVERSGQSSHSVDAPFAADGQMSPQRNVEPLMAADGQMSPRRNNISPRRKNNDHVGLLSGELDENEIKREQKERELIAERTKLRNTVQYRTKYGRARDLFGAPSPQPGGRGGPVPSRQVITETVQDDDQKAPVRSRQHGLNDDENNIQNGLASHDTTTARHPLSSFEKHSSIDYVARSERRQLQHQNKQKGIHGDPFMSDLLGQKITPRPMPQSSQQQQQHNYNNGGDEGFRNSGKYTPSWSEKNGIRTH